MITNDFIFIHIPKTGGSSIERFFGQDHGLPGTPPAHHNVHWYMKNSSNFDQLYKFSFVRNPWDRYVSLYFYKRERFNYEESFTDFCKNAAEYVLEKPGHRRQVDMLMINGEIAVDFVGKMENFQTDFDVVCRHLNIEETTLPHINQTKHKPWQEYYNDESRKIIEEIYKEDIDYFGYEF